MMMTLKVSGYFKLKYCLFMSPHNVGVEHWFCNSRVSGAIPGNLKKLFIWIKIHGLTQKQTVTEL